MRAVIYARFSSSKQRPVSIDDQMRVCRAFCAKEGYEVVAEYADAAISGRTDNRPEFQRMIQNAGESDVCVVYMMDRFSRDPYDAPYYKRQLMKRGCRVISATEPMIDSEEGILIEKIYEGVAAVESAHISKRTLRGMEGNALKCHHNGVPVFGYRPGEDGRYEVEPYEAGIVRECFERRLGGESVNSIASDLASRGIKTSQGNPAGHTFVNHILGNEKYTGVYSWGKTRVPDGMPRIIDDETFRAAQRVKGRKCRKDEHWRDYPLSGGKGLCSCGGHLVGVSTLKDGKRYHYYRCNADGCPNRIRADVLESAAVDCVRSLLADRGKALEVAGMVAAYVDGEAEPKRRDAQQRYDRAEKGISNLLSAIASGVDASLVQPKIAELQDELDAARHDLDVLEVMPRFDVEDFADFLQYGATLDDESVLDIFIQRVTLGDEVMVWLNYSLDGEPAVYRSTNLPKEVGTELVWLPKGETLLNVGYCRGFIVLACPRESAA